MDLATLAVRLGMSQPSATKHVQRLSNAGFVEGKRKGMRVLFSLTREARNSEVLWRIIGQDFF